MLDKIRPMLLLMCMGPLGPSQIGVSSEPAGLQSHYYALMDFLFKEYKLEVRPTTSGDVTMVFISIALRSIQDLNEKSQVLESSITIDAEWNDNFLAWNDSDFGGVSSFLYHQKKIWLPDIIIANSIESQSKIGYDENVVKVDSSGLVKWRAAQVIKTVCDIDVTFYPFDTQTCVIAVSTWMTTQTDVIIFPMTDTLKLSLAEYRPSGTWDIVSNEMMQESSDKNVTRLLFKLKLKRLRTYYVLNIILPIMFLSFTASMVFFLPADAGEKIGMCITVLLAYTVYLTIIADNMPQTSSQVSYLAVYITLLLGLTTMGVVLAVVVLHIHHKSDECKIGESTARITRKLRLWLGISQAAQKHFGRPNNRESGDLKQSQKSHQRAPSRIAVTPIIDKATICREPSCESQEEISWPKVAETVDRVMFLLTSALIAIITIIFFPILLYGD